MKNITREIIILQPNETANLITLNLIQHINSSLKVRAFELEDSFLAYLKDFRGSLFCIYVHEYFSNDLKAILGRVFSSQKDVEVSIINADQNQVVRDLKFKRIHQNMLVDEIIQNRSFEDRDSRMQRR